MRKPRPKEMKKPARVTGLFSGETGLNLGNLQSRSSGSHLPYMLESSRSLSETIRARARAGRDAHHFCLQSSCKQWPGVGARDSGNCAPRLGSHLPEWSLHYRRGRRLTSSHLKPRGEREQARAKVSFTKEAFRSGPGL